MKINIFLKKGVLLIAFTCFTSMLNGQTVSNYEYTGALQTYLVPAGVNSITIEAWGAEGGESDGSGSHGLVPAGQGGYAKGDLSVTPGQTLYIYVGGQGNINITYQSLSAGGWNGGGDGWGGWSGNWNAGNGTSGGGGGASDVRVGGTSLSDRVIVAGGGGGSDSWATARWGGDGGGLTGGTSGGGATGGTQSTGGLANHSNSTDGSFGQGGDGYTSSSQGHGAGGGGGYYGGGGGQHGGAGGSGGSSYIGGVINGSTTSGGREGNGLIIITAPESMPDPITSIDITGTSGFRMLSSPVSGAVYGDLLEELYNQGMTGSDNPGVDPNVWTYNSSWNALSDLTTDNYTAGSGVLVYVYADTDFDGTDDLPVTLTLDGTQNTSPVTIATNEDSWNLLGNPYGYSLSIQQLAADNSGYGPVYIWDSAAGAYKNHNGTTGDIADGLIAPFQGFFSQAAAGATSYTFTESSISTGTGTNYRTAVESEGSGVIAFTSGDQVSKVFLSFNLTGDFGMDHSDASRLLPLSHNDHLVSMFYVDDEAVAINNLPYDFNADLSVDLDVMHLQVTDSSFDPVSETITMTWDLSDVPEGINIVMMNNETYTIINLHEVDEYTFTLEDKDGFELEENVVGSYPLVGQSQFTMFISSATAGSDEAVLPKTFTLQPAYPNPFNPSTTIRYSIPETGSVLMKIYDLSGREVSTLIDQVMPAGFHSLSWNPQNTAAAGIYIIQVISGKEVLNQKITYLK